MNRRSGSAIGRGWLVGLLLGGWLAPAQHARATDEGATPLKRLTLEQLMQVEVTSPSKKPESLLETAAAVYVITQEDIRRSGATSLVEALRLAPGVHVARIDANTWAVGIRGFTSRLSRAVLVLIDGRAVYSPLFAGVYWEVQDTMLEDVERIEVIRGPGGTLWGANAVNGVINIITKGARETQGLLATTGVGTEERVFGRARYGGEVGPDLAYRVYGKGFERTEQSAVGTANFDGAQIARGGFRMDWTPLASDGVTLQGDLYGGGIDGRAAITHLDPPGVELSNRKTDVSGTNLLARWQHRYDGGSDSSVQLYYDRTRRDEPTFRELRDTLDFDFQHHVTLPFAQDAVWGLGYRYSSGDVSSLPSLAFTPPRRSDQLFQAFVQDEITLAPELLRLTIGTKFEHNDYSGYELQPSARLLLTPGGSQVFWAAISRPVRTPSRVEDDLEASGFVTVTPLPIFTRLIGNGNFDSERAVVYEAGYRTQPLDSLFVDVAGFYNVYRDLLGAKLGAPFVEAGAGGPRFVLPIFLSNDLDATVYGVEVALDTRPTDWWQVKVSYSYLQMDVRPQSGTDLLAASTAGSSPHNLASLESILDLPHGLELDTTLRYVDVLPNQEGVRISNYFALDLRLGWRMSDRIELQIVGQNLLASQHPEFGKDGPNAVEIRRGCYGQVTWRY
ncbi:MAG TPA: TonB-dependent receptor [Myxococcota bacterium]|nr:TonB-dependent receptor [Myxococcota bacterium]